jgi:hypothetical protein
MANVALVAVQDLESKFYSFWRPLPERTDLEAARLAGWSFVEGWERAIIEINSRLFPMSESHAWTDSTRAMLGAFGPSYDRIRSWLHGDCEFSYVVACRAALEIATINDRITRRNRV